MSDNTDGYPRVLVDFENEVRQRHLEQLRGVDVRPRVTPRTSGKTGNDESLPKLIEWSKQAKKMVDSAIAKRKSWLYCSRDSRSNADVRCAHFSEVVTS